MLSASFLRASVAALAITALAACDSAEERAEGHYQSGVELLENGDVKRALVEFRNVFALNDSHKDARLAYAKASRSVGNIAQSYSSYLKVVEEHPEELGARLQLVQMAIITQNWDEAERHGAELAAAEGDVEGKEVAALALSFRQAILDQDRAAMRDIISRAEELDKLDPADPILHRILVEAYQTLDEPEKALAIVDRVIALTPDDQLMYNVRASILQRQGDLVGLEAHLRSMIQQFPEDTNSKLALLRLLVATSQAGEAEQLLRDDIAKAENPLDAHIELIAFLRQLNGDEAALAEINDAISLYEDDRLLRALKAGIDFDKGDVENAVAAMQTVVEESPPGEEGDRLKVTLARMLIAGGNDVGARQLIEAVLESDPNQGDALKISAEWLIEADQADDAINLLRQAMDQQPDDADAMTLMALAHQRNGNMQLAQDLLALAVDASGNASDESLRFAQVLVQQGNLRSAEGTLVAALRNAPSNLDLLTSLGEIYMAQQDWSRAEQIEDALRKADETVGEELANNLRLQRIARQSGAEEAAAFLQELVNQDSGNVGPRIALVQTKIAEGKNDEALVLAQQLAQDFPDAVGPMMVLGNTQVATDDLAGAETTFRKVVDDTNDPRAVLQLVRIVGAGGRADEANQVIDDALEKSPDQPQLLWAKASYLESANDIDGAIAIYETLYTADSSSLVVANNLSSLIATYREDDESLARAEVVSRRLRGTDVPAFQDTYGWVQFRQGNLEEALEYLVPAAAGLDNDPIVQFHLGRAYQENGQLELALQQYKSAVSIAGESDTRKQIVEALEQVKQLENTAKE